MLICNYCYRDLDSIWQCNMSPEPFIVICEDCSGYSNRMDFHPDNNYQRNLENGED